MEGNSSKESVLEQLRNGFAKFELVSSPVPSISSYSPRPNRTISSYSNYRNNLFFARIGGDGVSPAMKKVERYSVKKVTGDGRCLFRALVKGMAIHKGVPLNSREETENADELRTAVKEVICVKDNERTEYAEALMAITVDESLKRCCQSCVTSRSLCTYLNVSTRREVKDRVSFQLQSMELTTARLHGQAKLRRL
ncbi:OVARIAN TUMOR DOMAIN-containing deubiquitinating enzyme 3 isoform X2 [Apium graveolens]|uniref:OVARIAN TUMOR DOMAIN-containing deubiquitinating enzyme 3 isoform X2 n=1 Tax=Apium graveolens TaxID=4045 RepID=UPI003D7BAD78